MERYQSLPDHIEIRGARVHNLKNVDVNIPLNRIVGIAGVSGSGKSSLALGVLYAEGSRRYLESLSTYTRRRMTQASRAQVDDVRYGPAALALHQRPGVPGIRSTFGTMTELLNSLRLMFSRLGAHRCPNGHYAPPSMAVAAEQDSLLTQSVPAALAAVPAVVAAVVPSRETITEAAPVDPAVAAAVAGMAARSHKAANAVHTIPKKVRRIQMERMVKTQVAISTDQPSAVAMAEQG